MPSTPSRISRLISLACILAALLAFFLGAREFLHGYASKNWSRTDGVISFAHTIEHPDLDSGSVYGVESSYDYKVAGIDYTGTRVRFGMFESSIAHAQTFVDRYPPGKTVAVFYSPTDPANSVLEPGIFGGTWIPLVVGGMFLIFGIGLIYWPWNETKAVVQANTQNEPPLFMGLIFILAGAAIFFMEPASGVPVWVVHAAAIFFGIIGLFIFARRLENKLWSKILMFAWIVIFLAIFHWLAFGAGELRGTVTTPFSTKTGTNVRPFFATFAIIFDVAILAGLINRLNQKKRK
ncbi:MAG: hypothetical protein JWR19_2906 [Pedosphaera sp.]|nr:hypothetical protein [Pedosphaera sp.]